METQPIINIDQAQVMFDESTGRYHIILSFGSFGEPIQEQPVVVEESEATPESAEEAKNAKKREYYKKRRESMSPEQIQASKTIATAQRKLREAKLLAKYPGMSVRAAKAAAAEAAARTV